jgi:hypothetical protein
MHHESSEALDQISQHALASSLAVMGWVGFTMSKARRLPPVWQILGGLMLSVFTAVVLDIFLQSSGMQQQLASATAAAIGSMGGKGYDYLIERVKAGK